MNAYKCDRCGRLYSRRCVPDITIQRYFHGYGDVKRFDLCDECQSALEEWLTEFKETCDEQS